MATKVNLGAVPAPRERKIGNPDPSKFIKHRQVPAWISWRSKDRLMRLV